MYSLGSVTFPVIALAAAVAGLARYTSLFGSPIRPTKLRLVVLMHFSPAARIPMNPPKHAPQVGALMTQPADDVEPGHVVHVIQRGYRLGDVVLRPARVIVAEG